MTELVDLEVLWNGVNDGRDGDLLQHDLRLPEKRSVEAREANRRTGTKDLVLATLERATAPLSMQQLCDLTGLPMYAVNSSVMAMIGRGLIDRTAEPIERSRAGRPARAYFLKGRVDGRHAIRS